MKDKNINIYDYLINTTNIVDEIKQTRLESASKIYNDSVNVWECYSRYDHYIDGYTYEVRICFQFIKHNEKYIFANYIKSVSNNSIKKNLVHSKYISEATAIELIDTLYFEELKPREKKEIYTQEEIDTLSKELLVATEVADKSMEEARNTAEKK